jgi:6-phosphogluconolactonase
VPSPILVITPSAPSLAARAADDFAHNAALAIRERGRFAVALSGGTTPAAMLAALADPERSPKIDWQRVHFFWSDERCVPPDDENSNYRMARTNLLARIAIPDANVHRMKGELEPVQGADEYSKTLVDFFGSEIAFDLCYLGLGPDGHTASLFPGTKALDATEPCVANRVDSGVASPWRLTLTYPVIDASRNVTFLVEGHAKAEIVRRVVRPSAGETLLPAQRVDPKNGLLRFFLDAPAAAQLM